MKNINWIKFIAVSLVAVLLAITTFSCSDHVPDNPEDSEEHWELKQYFFPYRLTSYIGKRLWEAETTNNKLENQNLVISPVGVTMTLSMLANGVEGKAKEELENLLLPVDSELEVYSTLEDLNRFNKEFAEELQGLDFKSKTIVKNSLWCAEDINLNADFGKTISKYYGKMCRENDISSAFNEWCSAESSGMIADILSEKNPASLVLSNLFSFSSSPARQFYKIDDGKFVNADGEEKKVEMLSTYLMEVPWTRTTTAEIIKVSLGEGGRETGLQLILAIPNEGADKNLSNVFDGEYIEGTPPYSAPYYNVALTIPSFTVESRFDIRDCGEALGIGSICDPSLKLPRMISSGDARLDGLIQASKIEFNESGFNSTQVSAAEMSRGGELIGGSKQISINGPFAFQITDDKMILMLGRIFNL